MANYLVVPVFWGNTFPRSSELTPYTPKEFTDALHAIDDSGYFSLLRQYGAEAVTIFPPWSFSDPWPAGDQTFVALFTTDQLVKFTTDHMSALPPVADQRGNILTKSIYLVIIPNGSLVDNNSSINGLHKTISYQDQTAIWAWIYGTSSIKDAAVIATHEIVEAIGADLSAPKELCDDCANGFANGVESVNGLNVARYYDAARDMCVAPGASWTLLDDNPDSASIVADGSHLYQLRRTGQTLALLSSAWLELDQNYDTRKIAASGGNLYQIHSAGKIWKYTGPPGPPHIGWQELDSNGDSVDIVADGSQLYQLHRSGRIWAYQGTPDWLELDRNRNVTKIAAGGGNLYKMHSSGRIWKYAGIPLGAWVELDHNSDTIDIVADGGALYQLRSTGQILALSSSGWLELDHNPDTKKIAAGGGSLYQIHKSGLIWKFTGADKGWLQIDKNTESADIAAGDERVYQIHSTGRIWSFPW